MDVGWIRLHRQIIKHWVFNDAEKLKAWITILLKVNHAPKKVNIKNKIILVKRGESVRSLETWATLFGRGWNKSKVRRFFKLLESDTMVELKPERITTHLRVCNYETYNGDRNTDETQMKRKRNTNETQVKLNNNEKNGKNEKKGKELPSEQNAFKKPSLLEWKNFGYGYACDYFNFAIDKEITFAKLENSYEYWFVPNGSGKTNWEKKKRSDWKRTVQTKIRSDARAIRSYSNSRQKPADKNRKILTGR